MFQLSFHIAEIFFIIRKKIQINELANNESVNFKKHAKHPQNLPIPCQVQSYGICHAFCCYWILPGHC